MANYSVQIQAMTTIKQQLIQARLQLFNPKQLFDPNRNQEVQEMDCPPQILTVELEGQSPVLDQ